MEFSVKLEKKPKAYNVSDVVRLLADRENVKEFLEFFITVSLDLVKEQSRTNSLILPLIIVNNRNNDVQFYFRYFLDVFVLWLSDGDDRVKRQLHREFVYGGQAYAKKIGAKAKYTDMLFVMLHRMYGLMYTEYMGKMSIFNSCAYKTEKSGIIVLSAQIVYLNVFDDFGLSKLIKRYEEYCESDVKCKVELVGFGNTFVKGLNAQVQYFNNTHYENLLFS